MSQAVNQAIQIDMGQTETVKNAKRQLFEDVAFAHYQEKWGDDPVGGGLTQESFCKRNADGSYFYTELNRAWWGFQAGFTAAALAGSRASGV